MMNKAIRDFPQQFEYEPVIENADKLPTAVSYIVGGMGGSAHASALMKVNDPYLDVVVRRNYGLPALMEKDLVKRMAIAISYSGNTEEPLDFYDEAQKKGLPLVAIATGGKLIERAKKDGVPYVQIPDTGIQPRSALGFLLRAQMKLMQDNAGLQETATLANILDPQKHEAQGKKLAERIKGKFPVVYTSDKNGYLGYVWKIKFNETGKIPSYHDVFPELNHNEVEGYEVNSHTKLLTSRAHFIFIGDNTDHERVQKRMRVTKKIYDNRGLETEELPLEGKTTWEKLFNSILIADWTSYYIAVNNGADPETVAVIEDTKKLMA